MKIGFKHYKTREWILERDTNELPVVPNKGDIIHLDGKTYKVKKREFGVTNYHENLLYIWVKSCSIV